MEPALTEARKLSRNGRLADALQIYDTLLKKASDAEIHWERIGLLRDMGCALEARQAITALLASDPENPRWLNGLAILEAEGKQWNDAMAALARTLPLLQKKGDWCAKAQANLAALYFDQGRIGEGLNTTRAALKRDRDMQRSHFFIGLYSLSSTKVSFSKAFVIDAHLHLYPYLCFDLALKEPRWILPITQLFDEGWLLQVPLPTLGSEGEYRLLSGRKVIAGVGNPEGFYGTTFMITSRTRDGLELKALSQPTPLTQVQRRGHIRSAYFDPILEIEVNEEDQWVKIPRGAYTVKDFSATGMSLTCRRELKSGQQLSFTFQLDKKIVRTKATVVRADPNNTYGIHFLLSHERDIESLHKEVFKSHLTQVRRTGKA